MNSQEKRIVQCPFCQTQFYVWISLLVDRRRVKCSSCGNIWFEDPTSENHEMEDLAPPALKPMRFIINDKDQMKQLPNFERDARFLEEPEMPKRKLKKRFSIIFIFLFLIFIFGRDYLIRLDPSLVNIYNILGLSLKDVQEGFEIRNTSWSEVIDKGIPSIVVNGELANMSVQLKSSPSVRITTRGKTGCHPMDLAAYVFGDDKAEAPDGLCIQDQWSIDVSYDRLLPGQVVPFQSIRPYDERAKVEKIQIDFVP